MLRPLTDLLPRVLTRLRARRAVPCFVPPSSVPPSSVPPCPVTSAPGASALAGSAPVLPQSPARGFDAYTIRLSAAAVPQLRRAAGIAGCHLIELLAQGHLRVLRERAIGCSGAWAQTPATRATLAGVPRELHLLVFDPEREAFCIVYAKADPLRGRLTVTGVVPARQYERAQWHLLPLALYQDLCAQAVPGVQQRERILAAALGERRASQLPIVLALENSKRAVWVELTLQGGQQKRLGVLPFALKQQRAQDLPGLAAFWDWVQSQRAGKAPIDPARVAVVRLLGQRDPYDTCVALGVSSGGCS